HAGERAPFRSHVRNGHPLIDGQSRDAVTDEFHRVIQNLVLVEQSTKRDDHILTDDAGPEFAFQNQLGDRRRLPPGYAGRPEAGGIRADHWRAEATEGAIKIGVGIGADDHRTRYHIALLDHDLVRDAGAGWVEIDAVLLGEALDAGVLVQILRRQVLNVM